jgi:hypothetical protein
MNQRSRSGSTPSFSTQSARRGHYDKLAFQEQPTNLLLDLCAPENFSTFDHLAVSSTIRVAKASGNNGNKLTPTSSKRDLNFGSARPSLMTRLSFSTITAGVPLGAPIPDQVTTS